jgi:hypothetical protein
MRFTRSTGTLSLITQAGRDEASLFCLVVMKSAVYHDINIDAIDIFSKKELFGNSFECPSMGINPSPSGENLGLTTLH